MSLRYIKLPDPICFVNPVTRQPIMVQTEKDGASTPDIMSFESLLLRVLSNPLWAENIAGMKCQQAIEDALEDARKNSIPYMAISEEAWLLLKKAVETPKTIMQDANGNAAQVVGFGVPPIMARQLLPLLNPILDASSSKPQ